MKVFELVLECISKLHLYSSKEESLFKAVALTISWSAGVLTQNLAAAYFLFSVSIVMEYVVQLINERQIIPKILPGFLTIFNIAVLIISLTQILNSETEISSFQIGMGACTIVVIGVDTIVMLLIEPPNKLKIESNIGQLSDDEKFGE